MAHVAPRSPITHGLQVDGGAHGLVDARPPQGGRRRPTDRVEVHARQGGPVGRDPAATRELHVGEAARARRVPRGMLRAVGGVVDVVAGVGSGSGGGGGEGGLFV